MKLGGVTLDLAKVTLPVFHVATREDHIAPAASVYRGAKMLGSRDATFVLAGSGHIAGVVNPPAGGKYQFWTQKGMAADDLKGWAEGATETPGSWWPLWDAWLARRGRAKVAARRPGARLGVIEDAPGSFVRVRFDRK
jgi:polyhydroxyalkanoate synthase